MLRLPLDLRRTRILTLLINQVLHHRDRLRPMALLQLHHIITRRVLRKLAAIWVFLARLMSDPLVHIQVGHHSDPHCKAQGLPRQRQQVHRLLLLAFLTSFRNGSIGRK